jgi:hypothetical protein
VWWRRQVWSWQCCPNGWPEPGRLAWRCGHLRSVLGSWELQDSGPRCSCWPGASSRLGLGWALLPSSASAWALLVTWKRTTKKMKPEANCAAESKHALALPLYLLLVHRAQGRDGDVPPYKCLWGCHPGHTRACLSVCTPSLGHLIWGSWNFYPRLPISLFTQRLQAVALWGPQCPVLLEILGFELSAVPNGPWKEPTVTWVDFWAGQLPLRSLLCCSLGDILWPRTGTNRWLKGCGGRRSVLSSSGQDAQEVGGSWNGVNTQPLLGSCQTFN